MTLRLALVALLAFILQIPVVAAQINTRSIGVTEADLKAVFVIRLLDFIQRDQPLDNTTICLRGRSDTTAAIQRLVASRGSKKLSIDQLEAGDAVDACHLLFDSSDAAKDVQKRESYFHVLTVSDKQGFAATGGMVELVRQNNRIKLTINALPVRDADIQLSSRLLMLATVIQPNELVQHGD